MPQRAATGETPDDLLRGRASPERWADRNLVEIDAPTDGRSDSGFATVGVPRWRSEAIRQPRRTG